ncbi:transposase, partial [Methylorubrum aminovorans]
TLRASRVSSLPRSRWLRCNLIGCRSSRQTPVSLTLARCEILVAISLWLFLPEVWSGDPNRMARAGVPEDLHRPRAKAQIAFCEIDRVRAEGRAPRRRAGLCRLQNFRSLESGKKASTNPEAIQRRKALQFLGITLTGQSLNGLFFPFRVLLAGKMA